MPAALNSFTRATTPGGTSVPGGSGVKIYAFQATARIMFDGTDPARIPEQATRTAQSCYMVGLSERVTLRTSSNSPWIWRRICFTSFTTMFNQFDGDPPIPAGFHITGSGNIGTMRAVADLNDVDNAPMAVRLTDLLFRGTQNIDWISPIDAPTDPARVKVWYDKRITLTSGNDVGVMRTFKRWHGMRKTLMYNDVEVGSQTISSYYTAENRRSMGDYYVIDMFEPQTGATDTDAVLFAPESRLYWHER